jgi:secondary thiamine-phosphate synthase enzyme
MEIKKETFSVQTHNRIETQDISGIISRFLRESGLSEGLLFVYCPHATAAIFLNENESGLQRDVLGMIKRLIPQSEQYEHNAIDDNAAAHLAAILVGNCVVIPVSHATLGTGTWQQVFLLELDGPRQRTVNAILLGD